MMRRKRYTVVAALLLCAVNALCSDGVKNQKCVSSWEEDCFQPADHLNASDPVSLKSTAGEKLIVSLEGLPDSPVCQWGREQGPLMNINRSVSMVIPRLSRTDSGIYTLSCESLGRKIFSKTVALNVVERPSKPQLSLDRMDNPALSPYFKCISQGSPRPKIEWLRASSRVERKNLDDFTAESSDTASNYYDHEVTCCATNDEGQECTQLYDFDLNAASTKPGEVSSVTISPGEPLLLRCRKYDDPNMNWEHNGKILVDSCTGNKICISRDDHMRSQIVYAFIRSATLQDNGTYTCKDTGGKAISVDVHVTAESFLSSQLSDQFVFTQNSPRLTANVSYHPVLQHCYWEAPDGSFTKCIRDQGGPKHRPLRYCGSLQSGVYKLHLVAGGKTETKTTIVCVVGNPPSGDYLLMPLKIGVMALLLALTVVSLMLVHYIKKKKPQYQPQLQMIQMVGPNDNDYIYINFKDFNYDKKWEFPRENLELGKELGSGAFGMVVQATAYGINKPGVSQQVAVKMLKEKHQSVEKEALMSELKMLTHIGQHANIVNLLGACTETGPIYLIFQYCCYGDLLNYLKKSGDRYHKSVTDAFSRDRFSSLYNNTQPKKNYSVLIATDDYIPMHGSTTRGQEDIALITFSSNDMEDPEMYESEDDQMEQQALTFDDLLSFAFQVAKGMEFLSAKNCIHRDLAARNVLVTKGRLVKIGDFGLARDIDNDSNYVVRGNVRLPVKWMAPESIFQGMYTMKSDVWAYGILLWEIFSLGVTPYPGIKVDHTFYSMIERGFKMECPYYANDSVYDIMRKCWNLDPNNRPSFSKLVDFMSNQLMDMEEKLYQNMHDQDLSGYQNASTIVDISALVKESENKTAAANDYCKANQREESKAEASKSESAVEEEKEPLKPSNGE
ncbi:receptor-type tyrosine-protein kinase FLT3-like [Anableps anableps]